MLVPILGTFTGDPLLDLFAIALVFLMGVVLLLNSVSEVIKLVLNKLIFHNKKYTKKK